MSQNNQVPSNFQQCVFNATHTVAKNLRFIDANGDPTSRQFTNDYLDNVGQNVSSLIDEYNQILTVLQNQGGNIVTLQQEVTALLTSGFTLPSVSAGCLSSGNTLPINTVTSLLVTNTCSYNSALDTPANLSRSVLVQGVGLNTGTAFSNPGTTMSNIAGWNQSPTTTANTINNLWLAVNDLRGGMSLIMQAITPSCNQIVVNYITNLPSFTTGIQLFFAGYTFIPTGYADAGSTITVTDTANNTITQSLNIITASTSGSVTIPISGTALLANSNYTVTVTSNVTNATWKTSCQKTTIKTVTNNIAVCPTITTFSVTNSISFIMTPLITTGVSYAVSLLSSGSTVLSTQTYANPSAPVSGNFGSLTALTAYYIRVTTTLTGQTPTVCALNAVSTTS